MTEKRGLSSQPLRVFLPAMLRSDIAQLAGLFVESIFYGIYLVTFGYCLQALFRKQCGWRSLSELNLGSVFVALSLFCIGTINLALAFYRIQDIQKFAFDTSTSIQEYAGKPWVNIVKASTMNAQVLIADGALIYRCWHVYGRRGRIVLFPIVLWFGALAVTICMLWAGFEKLRIHSATPSLNRFVQLVCTVFWVITIVLNIYATGMIVFRICQVDKMKHSVEPSRISEKEHHSERPARLQEVVRIVVDSGLMYTATSFMVFCAQVAESTSVYITSSADMIVIGIAFNLINIRVAKARTRNAITPSITETKPLTILEFNHNPSLAGHESHLVSSHSSRVNTLSGVHRVEISGGQSAETIV
ncbi:hypothetical protein BDN70DRAFT_181315 [Pholiota conissans]|uniref:Uncharacterized protein n=1 Tax=Pholiota conissans TaxID=109636 RepID=A0A9P5ZAM5_9AGAR|nr:hypothetical protein BDN70DRAFT_181315 [Pholiota conissans]